MCRAMPRCVANLRRRRSFVGVRSFWRASAGRQFSRISRSFKSYWFYKHSGPLVPGDTSFVVVWRTLIGPGPSVLRITACALAACVAVLADKVECGWRRLRANARRKLLSSRTSGRSRSLPAFAHGHVNKRARRELRIRMYEGAWAGGMCLRRYVPPAQVGVITVGEELA